MPVPQQLYCGYKAQKVISTKKNGSKLNRFGSLNFNEKLVIAMERAVRIDSLRPTQTILKLEIKEHNKESKAKIKEQKICDFFRTIDENAFCIIMMTGGGMHEAEQIPN